MKKIEVLRQFRNADTGERYKVGEVVELDDDRFNQMSLNQKKYHVKYFKEYAELVHKPVEKEEAKAEEPVEKNESPKAPAKKRPGRKKANPEEVVD